MAHVSQTREQGQQGEGSRGHSRETAPSIWEWLVAALGLLLLLATLGYLGWHALSEPARAPEPVAQVLKVERQAQGFLVRVRVSNRGGETASSLRLSGVLKRGDEVVEESEVDFQYLPGGSSREGGLIFTHDPAQFALELTPKGYEKP